jgi:ABC-type dipeptide/oligopeptide/nickel transport system permease subunit
MTRGGRVAISILALLALFAVAGPHFAPDRDATGDLLNGTLLRPSATHWLGTDALARDIFARLAHGARVSLSIAALAIGVATLIGILVGLAAGAHRRRIAGPAGHVINLGLALPRVLVLLVLLAATGALPVVWLGVLLGVTGWPAIARMVRGEALRLRHATHVTASVALGATPGRVVWHNIFPGTLPAVLVAASLGVADAILLEAGLSFIGVGIRPPTPSWGNMILEARDHIADAPWLLIAPCVALVVTTAAATLLGESLRRSLYPESR